MSAYPVPFLVLIGAIALVAAAIVVLALLWIARPRRRFFGQQLRRDDDSAILLFDGEALVDASGPGRALLRRNAADGTDRETVVGILARRFPDLPASLASLPENATNIRLAANAGPDGAAGALEVVRWDGFLRLTLLEDAPAKTAAEIHPLTLAAIEDELDTLRSLGEIAPMLIWKEDAAGRISWANRAYLHLAELVDPPGDLADPRWPLPRIFDESDLPLPSFRLTEPVLLRRAVTVPGRDEKQWFEVTSQRRGPATMRFAINANGIVEAEQAQRNFVQTLTKTFAHLSTGLAIFDRKRRLVLFNPALLDLTGLPVGFLSSRPQVHTVLDRLRDMNMLPEPKNYASWRDQVAALEAAAQKGTYCETWNLAGGQTYRVSGRPHPDGAIAFLFEDISHEISLTRHFRAEIDTAQAVLDTMDEAIAVFSVAGTLTMSNAAYDRSWRAAAVDSLQEAMITDEMRQWQTRCAPTSIWADLRTYLRGFGDRAPWTGMARLDDGRALLCRFVPLPGGATLIGFNAGQPMAGGLSVDPDSRRPRAIRDNILATGS